MRARVVAAGRVTAGKMATRLKGARVDGPREAAAVGEKLGRWQLSHGRPCT